MTFQPSRTKADAVRRLGQVLGYAFDLYIGSSVPKELFTAATRLAHVSDDGSMPVRAQRVVEAAGLPWGSECDSRNTPSGGGATVTLAGLNRLLQAIQTLGRSGGPDVPEPEPEGEFGKPYKEREGAVAAVATELTRDWDALDRATRAHQRLEKELADYVAGLGIQPRSPNAYEPKFDLGWLHEGTTVIVEVKSANDENHRQQVRLGMGQAMEYVALLQDNAPGDYRPVLLLEEAPDAVDYLLAAHSGVLIIGPEGFAELALESLLP